MQQPTHDDHPPSPEERQVDHGIDNPSMPQHPIPDVRQPGMDDCDRGHHPSVQLQGTAHQRADKMSVLGLGSQEHSQPEKSKSGTCVTELSGSYLSQSGQGAEMENGSEQLSVSRLGSPEQGQPVQPQSVTRGAELTVSDLIQSGP
jgi:hypothetical protein